MSSDEEVDVLLQITLLHTPVVHNRPCDRLRRGLDGQAEKREGRNGVVQALRM
jgi:hypothetical protein